MIQSPWQQILGLVNLFFWSKREYQRTGGVAAAANLPIVLDADGYIDASMINDADIDHGGLTGLGDDDHVQYLLASGARPLTADWDAGGFEVRAQTLEADVATGTA